MCLTCGGFGAAVAYFRKRCDKPGVRCRRLLARYPSNGTGLHGGLHTYLVVPFFRTCFPVVRVPPNLRTCSQIMNNESYHADSRGCELVPTILRKTKRKVLQIPSGIVLMWAFADSQTKTNFKNLRLIPTGLIPKGLLRIPRPK